MGKEGFERLYVKLKSTLTRKLTIKQSTFSDMYQPGKNYAGVIVYMVDGKAQWRNSEGGRANGWRGRAFYVVISCTNNWPRDVMREVGQGRVHHYLLKNTLGIDFNQDRIACGGFSYVDGKLKFSSVWLNGREQMGTKCDGWHLLSRGERILVEFAFADWKANGIARVVEIPPEIERRILQNRKEQSGLCIVA